MESLGLHPSEMQSVLVDREVWRLNLELLPAQPLEKSEQRKKILKPVCFQSFATFSTQSQSLTRPNLYFHFLFFIIRNPKVLEYTFIINKFSFNEIYNYKILLRLFVKNKQ